MGMHFFRVTLARDGRTDRRVQMGGQVIHTVCLDTRDAIHREEGKFTMRLGGDNPRFQAIKVALGSLEFPMVQWTVEPSWNRLYYSEGIRFTPDCSWLKVCEQTDGETTDVVVQLPLHVNRVVRARASGRGVLLLRCEHRHGLWVGDGKRCTIPAITWGDVELICGSMGRLSLTSLHSAGSVHYVSDTEFSVVLPAAALDTTSGGFLHVPTCPSPGQLCDVVSRLLAYSPLLAPYEVVYTARDNRAVLQATAYPEGATSLTVKVHGSGLAALLGYPSRLHERRFVRPRGSPHVCTFTGFDICAEGGSGTPTPLCLPSEPFGGWEYVELTPGWYAPSQRAMCTGQPLRMPQQLEAAFSRLQFQVPERIPAGMATAHFLMYDDPGGTVHYCPVYAGTYSAPALARALEVGMTRLAAQSMPGTVYTVEFGDDSRFHFVCEVKDGAGTVRPAQFSLLLNHPAQFDPSRIGFPAAALHGKDAYHSAHRVHSRVPRPHANTYCISEVGHQKRFSVQIAPADTIVAVITDYCAAEHVLHLCTYAGQLPYAHGMQAGDVVRISAAGENDVYTYSEERSEWALLTVKSCPIAPAWERCGVVVRPKAPIRRDPGMPAAEQTALCVQVRPTARLADYVGLAVQLKVDVQPFNLCFGLPGSIPAEYLGFPGGATECGYSSFIEAPCVHSLGHPDYVLMYIDEGKKATGLQHQRGTDTTSPFAKIVLYPMFREERMLPRESTLLSGESLTVFNIRFENPDGSPYHFHGAHFSFSFNFIKMQEG